MGGPVWTLLLLFVPLIAQGAETDCDARKKNICYGALGGFMDIQLMDNGSTTERCVWNKNGLTIFHWRNYKLQTNMLKYRSVFSSDTGIFEMRNLSKDDTDSYTLEFHEKGQLKDRFTHKLIIQAPVSSVHLASQCLSKGEMRVTCTAEGDSPEFSWTLGGQNLTDSQLLPNDEENTITLKQNTEGQLRCSVRNKVSEDYKELNIPTCGYIFINCTFNGTQISDWVYKGNNSLCNKQTSTSAPITPGGKTSTLSPSNQTDPSPSAAPWYIRSLPIIVGALAAILIVGIAAVALMCVLKKRRKNNKDEEHELTYADVRILQQPGRRAAPQPSETVEYGQVKLSNQNQRETTDNDCIYAKVRK